MFGTFRMIMVGVMVAGLAGAGAYVFKLRADNATLKANQIKLESAVSEQKELIQKQQNDFKEILQANQDMNKLVEVLKKDIDELDKRFNKGKRDIGKLAVERSKVIEKIINKGGENAARCLEIASGAPLTEQEKNAKKKSEINPECPSIANPNYVAY
jgi:NAD-dependent SIR2 family protein deacetylase